MRKLVLKMSVSADGFVAGPNGEMDWLLRSIDKSALEWVEKTLWQAGVHIMGRRTFVDMAAYWPTSSGILAAPMNEIPKVVFSKKGFSVPASAEETSSWTNVHVAKDLVPEITKLKQQDGNFILAHGGAGFAQELVKYELIDEYRLVIHPVILGKGLPLFAFAPKQIQLKLESSTSFASGVIANIYTPEKRSFF